MISKSRTAGLYHQLVAGSAASLGVLTCAAVFAWITPILPGFLGPSSEIPMTSEEASWMVSMPEFGNLISPLPAGYLADQYGRKIIILASGPMFLVGWIIVLYFKTLAALIIARIIQGIGIGIIFTVVPMYLGEIASTKYRGTVTSLFYLFWWFGFLLEYVLGAKLTLQNFTYVTASFSVIFFVAFLWQPESPYYFIMKNDIINARKSLYWLLQSSNEETEKELGRMKHSVEEDQKKEIVWNELVATPTDRKALMILFFVGFLRMFCGVIPLSLYSTQTLDDTKSKFVISPDYVTVIMGMMMLVGSLCSFFTIDIFGRRPLLLFSCSISGISMFCAGTYYVLESHSSQDMSSFNWIPPISLIVLSSISVIGIFPINVSYSSELFTSNTRGTASSVFSIFGTVLGILVIKFYLTIFYTFGAFVNFYIFAFVCLLGSFSAYSVMPETKGKTFEQIRQELGQK